MNAQCRPAVLVVDDDREVRALLGIALTSNGFDVTLCASGREALSEFSGNRFDVALMDVDMPDLSGPATLAEMRRLVPRQACCFMSGRLEAVEQAVDPIISKPFKIEELISALNRILGRKHGE